MMTELKPCPFCGSEAYVIIRDVDDWTPWIRCKGCGVETDCFDSAEEAIEAWNRRVDNE